MKLPGSLVPSFRLILGALSAAAVALMLVTCDTDQPSAQGERQERPAIEVGKPYPYSEPAPPEEPTPLDGTYLRTITVEQAGGAPVYCQRCAPWRLDAGEASLRFDRGEMTGEFEPIRVQVDCESETRNIECKHPPGFNVSAHYRVDGDRVEIFNDGNCIGMTGIYRWSITDGALVLEVVEDECPFVRLRSKYLTAAPWEMAEAG